MLGHTLSSDCSYKPVKSHSPLALSQHTMVNRICFKGGDKIYANAFLGICIPLLGSSLGAALVFFTGRRASRLFCLIIEGSSAGVMLAASVWSLLIPSIELAEQRGGISALPATLGFILGVSVFLLADHRLKRRLSREGNEDGGGVTAMIAVAVHNLPEGMAVGAIFADLLSGAPSSTLAAAMALSVGIAVQNIPEGAIVSIPLRARGMGRLKAFGIGVLSGVVEPIGALFTILASGLAVPFLPYMLSFAAGAMTYAVLDGFLEVPREESSAPRILSFCGGFCVMMCLDVILG